MPESKKNATYSVSVSAVSSALEAKMTHKSLAWPTVALASL